MLITCHTFIFTSRVVSLIHTYHLQIFHLIDHAVWFYARDDADVDDDDDKNKAGELVGASLASSAGVTPRRHGQGIVAEASNRRTNQLHGDSCRQPVMESRGPASVSPAPTPTRDYPSVLSRQQVCTETIIILLPLFGLHVRENVTHNF